MGTIWNRAAPRHVDLLPKTNAPPFAFSVVKSIPSNVHAFGALTITRAAPHWSAPQGIITCRGITIKSHQSLPTCNFLGATNAHGRAAGIMSQSLVIWNASSSRYRRALGASRPISVLSSIATTKIPSPSNGPKLPTKSWLQLNASATKRSRHYAANYRFTGLGCDGRI